VVVGLGSTMGTAKSVVDELREEGKKVGSIRIRVFRPFPGEILKKVLCNFDAVGVLDRGISFGHFGQLYSDLCATLYGEKGAPMLIDFVYGLGGRDMPQKLLKKIFEEVIEAKTKGPEPVLRIKGVR